MVIPAALVLLLPLAGAAAMGKSLASYLQFPPKTPDAPHVPFSLPVFLGLALPILAATVPLLLREWSPLSPARPAAIGLAALPLSSAGLGGPVPCQEGRRRKIVLPPPGNWDRIVSR
jgi:hypothetical protein